MLCYVNVLTNFSFPLVFFKILFAFSSKLFGVAGDSSAINLSIIFLFTTTTTTTKNLLPNDDGSPLFPKLQCLPAETREVTQVFTACGGKRRFSLLSERCPEKSFQEMRFLLLFF